MLELPHFLLRRPGRRRSTGSPAQTTEVCELRLLLSATIAGEVTAAEDATVDPTAAESSAEPAGEEEPGEEPVDEPGGESPDDTEEGAPYFDSLHSRLSRDGTQVIITGNVNSLTGGDTVTFFGAATGSVTVNEDGNFSFTFDYNGNGIASVTAMDLNGNSSETQYLFL